jgi:hypothetical protein
MKKKLTAEDLTTSAWAAALADVAPPTDTVPEDWFTIVQLGKKTKTAVATLQTKMRRLLSQGKAERKNFRIKLLTSVRPVPHYRLK